MGAIVRVDSLSTICSERRCIIAGTADDLPREHARAHSYFTRVASGLDRSLKGWTATVVEPTDNGYLFGYELELGRRDGSIEKRLVFVEGLDSASERSLFPIDEPGAIQPRVWVYPQDPALPALQTLLDLSLAQPILDRLGIGLTATTAEVVSYRPGRRAVIRMESTTSPFFVKVVEPVKAAAIAERHQQFRTMSLPVPRLLGWSPEGIIALSGLDGIDAQSAVPRMRDYDLFLDRVEFLIGLLADIPAYNTARSSLFERLDWYVDRLIAHLPAQAERITALGEIIARRGMDGRSYLRSTVTIHGDLHLGQLFVDADDPCEITGLLDIDTAGAGDPADDAAALYAHLIALGEMARPLDPHYAEECWALAARWLARWQRNRNAGFALRARAIAATHLLGHALRPVSADGDQASVRLLERAEFLMSSAST